MQDKQRMLDFKSNFKQYSLACW